MTTTYAWGATGMRQIDDPEKVNVAFVQHEDFARAEAEVARLTWYKSRADDIVRYLSMKPPQITAVEAVIAELTLRAAKERP